MLLWVLLILLANGIVAFSYAATTTQDPSTLWGLFSANFLFFLGVSQAGIVFSAIMRIAKSEWGKHYNRLGEIFTLAFFPVAVVMFIVIYKGGAQHLFYWASPEKAAHAAHGEPLSPWLGMKFQIWRTVVTMALFYIMSLIYFVTARKEENGQRASVELTKKLNVMAGFVMFFFVWANTEVAWDFGMMILPHWESTIFPAYYWVSNVFAGAAFLFLIAHYFIPKAPGEHLSKDYLDSVGKLLIGFTLLWIYMFWSQYIVIWYGDMPELTAPLFKRMGIGSHYGATFALMLLAIFIIPFFGLSFRKIKLNVQSLSAVAILICFGVYINRYLMIVPTFTDGSTPVFATYAGVSLLFGGLATAVLSVMAFRKLFPGVPVKIETHE